MRGCQSVASQPRPLLSMNASAHMTQHRGKNEDVSDPEGGHATPTPSDREAERANAEGRGKRKVAPIMSVSTSAIECRPECRNRATELGGVANNKRVAN